MINAASTNSSNTPFSCAYYGKDCHTVDRCYRKHGYPPDHKYHKPQGSSINNVNVAKEENANSDVEQNQEARGLDVKLIAQQCKA